MKWLTCNLVNTLDCGHIQRVADSFAVSIVSTHLYCIQIERMLAHNFANNHVLDSFDHIHHHYLCMAKKKKFSQLVPNSTISAVILLENCISDDLFTLWTIVITLLVLYLRHRIRIAVVKIGLLLWLLMMIRWPLHVSGWTLWTRSLWPLRSL